MKNNRIPDPMDLEALDIKPKPTGNELLRMKSEVYDLSRELKRIEKRLQELNRAIQEAEAKKEV